MAYLLPAGSAPRTKNKWGLGALLNVRTLPARAAFGNGSGVIFPGPMPVGPVGPIIKPIWLPPKQVCSAGDVNPPPGAVWDPVNCRYSFGGPPTPPATPVSTSTSGTPVPPGFPKNQFFVAPDGSVWEYSSSSGSWFNTGTPYQQPGAVTPVPVSTSSDGSAASAPAQPVSVTVTTPGPADSGYQSILNWLTQQNLIGGVPNWLILAGGGLAYKMFFASSGSGRGR